MEVAIARPSIVMGESDTGWTPAFNVLYWPLRAFARGLFEQVPALPDGRVDVVPVDYVADGIAKLIETDATGTFNLVAGEDASTVEELSDLACTHFDRAAPAVRADRRARPARRPTSTARSTCRTSTWRSCSTTPARASCSGSRAPPLRGYFDTLMDYADRREVGQARHDARRRARGLDYRRLTA